ncbi:MAG: hypothetical protein K8T91_19625, partial [Planctomycetes bacterium]|nr:hypothetical protein [Planctomycetota bacterium]
MSTSSFGSPPQGSSPSSGSTIEFRCTSCSKLLRTAADAVGRQVKCPECQTILMVPAADGRASGSGGFDGQPAADGRMSSAPPPPQTG